MAMKSCELYVIATEKWASVADLNEARGDHACVVLENGGVFVFCGVGEDDMYLDSIEFMKGIGVEWEKINVQHPISARGGCTAAVITGD